VIFTGALANADMPQFIAVSSLTAGTVTPATVRDGGSEGIAGLTVRRAMSICKGPIRSRPPGLTVQGGSVTGTGTLDASTATSLTSPDRQRPSACP